MLLFSCEVEEMVREALFWSKSYLKIANAMDVEVGRALNGTFSHTNVLWTYLTVKKGACSSDGKLDADLRKSIYR